MVNRFLSFLERGERPLGGKPFDEMDGVHTKPYIYAAQFVQDKSVLDCGCGGGYGSDYLAKNGARTVIGTDLSVWSIDQAKMLYKQDNLQFLVMDGTDLKFKDCIFDVVTSFQVIEHLRDCKKHLSEVKRVLKPGGIFIIATPNKNITSPHREKPIFPFHIKEFYPNELYTLLRGYFEEVKVMGQKIVNEPCLRKEIEFRESQRMKVIRALSSFNIVRIVARSLPLRVKDFFTRPPRIHLKPEDLEISEKYREDGYILVATCKKVKRR